MPIINNPFNGKLNLDVAEYRISNGDYIDALNITKDAQGRGQDRVVSNILGNTLIPYTLPEGENKIIGFYPDRVRNRAYYFLWNSNGYNTILYYDMSNDTITSVLESKTQSNGIDILNFNPSYKVLSVNIFYRDLEGDILFFNDGYNPPKSLNVINIYGNDWQLEYLLVAKSPPVMPPKVVYENDTTITVNNLRNKLFQFCYRYVYDNNEKSVWSSKSIVPLPQQASLNLTDNNATNNARIAVIFSTGGPDVKAIELSFRETTNGLTSDWFLIKSFDKQNSTNPISDYSVYDFRFYNDSIYNQIDVIESSQLQDWVPQKANAGELANGNVLLYAGITEGYDKTNVQLSVTQTSGSESYYYEQDGLLFLAIVNGTDSGVASIMDIYIYGTGENGEDGTVTSLNNGVGGYYINSLAPDGTDLSTSYTTFEAFFVSAILAGISAAMVAKGYTQVGSIVGNKLTLTRSGGFTLCAVGFKTIPVLASDNTRFSSAWDSGYQYAIQYFDAQGRTIGAQTSVGASVNTPSSVPPNPPAKIPEISLNILNRPPLYATYYQVLRSNNTTYNKRLFWVSQSAFAGIADNLTDARFIYINIDNISTYNESISSTQNIVSYNYTDGDRIRFIGRYDILNDINYFETQFDYEIVGTVTSFEYRQEGLTPEDKNIYIAKGNFLKIRYPDADISDNFNFTGMPEYWHYQFLLYNYSSNASSTQRFYYEFGKQYGIGNPGTENRYHFGVTQLPNGGATIPVTNGDLFYRLRKVPFSDAYTSPSSTLDVADSGGVAVAANFVILIPGFYVDTPAYLVRFQTLVNVTLGPGGLPIWSMNNGIFYNKLTASQFIVSFKASITVNSNDLDGATYALYALILTDPATTNLKYTISLLPKEFNNIPGNQPVTFDVDKRFTVPPTGKVYIVFTYQSTGGTLFTTNFDSTFSIIRDSAISIIEPSFSDNYNLVTNSNGRPSAIDVNARQTYFPTLIRFGQAYQSNTNINATNRFYYEDFDEYDRTFGDVLRLHVRDRYLKVYQKFKVGNVPILTQIVKDVTGNPLQANSNQLINKIQYYAGDYGIGDAATSLAWNNFADYFVDNFRGVVCRLSQDGITPISILYYTNAFFVPLLQEYRQELNNGVADDGQVYTGNPCIYGVFDAYTNKYIIAMEEINRYYDCNFNGGTAISYAFITTTTTTAAPTTTSTTSP